MAGRDFETEYLKREIEGKSNIEIVVMLYEAGIKFMNRAINYIQEKNIEKTHYNITKAQNIVNELSNMLDMNQGGEISKNLFNLYGFIQERLMTGNIKKDPAMIKEAIEIFSSLKEAWVEIARQAKEGTVGKEAPAEKAARNPKKPLREETYSKTSRPKRRTNPTNPSVSKDNLYPGHRYPNRPNRLHGIGFGRMQRNGFLQVNDILLASARCFSVDFV